MKKRLTSPTFDASEKTVTHASFSDVTLAGIQLIVNVTDQIIIYNFADTTKGGTLSTDTLTLEYDTTSMSDTDELMVLVEDGSATHAVSGTVTAELSATDNAVLDTIAAKDFATQTTLAAINTKLAGGTVIGDVNLGATDNAVLDAIESDTTTIAGDTTSIDDKLPALGQALAAASVPVVLPAAQITTLTPPAAITGFATSAKQDTIIGHVDGIETVLGTIDTDTGNIATSAASIDGKTPALGQALAAASVPVVLTAAQLTTLTPPAAITGFATSAKQDTIISHVDGIEALLTTIDTNIDTKTATEATLALVQGDTSDVATNTGDISTSTGATTDAAATAGSTGSIQAKLRLLTSQLDAVKTAVETIDNAISGSEMQVDVVGALPAGTNAIGKLAANSGVDIGDVTLTAGTAAIGTLLPPDIDVTAHTNYAKKYYTNAGAVTDGIIWSPAAGKRWHVVVIRIQVSAACTVTLEDDKAGGDEAIWKSEFAANSGSFEVYPDKYPLASGEDAADLIITTTAGNVYVTCVGYEI